MVDGIHTQFYQKDNIEHTLMLWSKKYLRFSKREAHIQVCDVLK